MSRVPGWTPMEPLEHWPHGERKKYKHYYHWLHHHREQLKDGWSQDVRDGLIWLRDEVEHELWDSPACSELSEFTRQMCVKVGIKSSNVITGELEVE